jgi:serine protease AprX
VTHDSTGARLRRARLRLSLWVAVAFTALLAIHPGNSTHAQTNASGKLDPALAARLATATPVTPLDVVIVFSDPVAASGVQAMAARFRGMQVLPMAGAILTPAQIDVIAAWPEVLSITLNAPLKYFLHEAIPLINADDVWRTYGQTGGNAAVAVIDSGIDATHPDLLIGSKVIQNVKVTPYGQSLENMAVTDTSSGHGTHVAGTIGGNGASSGGYYRGVAPDAKLIGLGAGEALSILTAVQAYDWVLQHHEQYNIRVVSNSWGSTGGEISLRNPITVATYEGYKRGILSVFAAGNDGGYDVMNPYSLAPWVLSVAAGKKDGTLADFSSRGLDGDYFKHPDITAPGVNIVATRTKTVGITAADPFPNPVNPLWTASYTVMSGTSMATPHVSGAAALLFSSNPKLSPDEVMNLLTGTVKPMPAYALHEAGYGYMDVLAAYEASRALAGSLDAFVAGQQQHSEDEVLGFDLEAAVPYDEFIFTGLTAVGASDLPAPIDHTFAVPEGTLYVDVRLTWTPQIEDAYDIEILDPEGRIKVSSGNGLDSPEAALFVPATFGTYTLRLHPFAAVATQYEARVKVAYGARPAGWPPSTTPTNDVYLGLSIYKLYVAAGIPTDRFRTGDQGWINFMLKTAGGLPIEGAGPNLTVVYTDRNGKILATGDQTIAEDGAGEYSTYFDTSVGEWTAGPIGVSFLWSGAGSMRAVPTSITLNGLDVSLQTPASAYNPGDTVTFNGVVVQNNPVAGGSLQTAMIGGARVTIRLLDATGKAIVSTQAQTDAQGQYGGSLVAPASARGPMTLAAEAAYTDPTIPAALGTPEWWGTVSQPLVFPGNRAPDASVSVTKESGAKKNHFYVALNSAVSDADGRDDVTGITLVLADARGRTIRQWTAADFTAGDAATWRLSQVFRISGVAPWTLTLTAQDSVGQRVTKSHVIP